MPAPIVSATIQASTLACISNILAQILDAWRKNLPLSLSLPDFIRFLILTLLTAPPNFLWQAWLERTFPGRKPTADADILLAERGDDGSSGLLDPMYEKDEGLAGLRHARPGEGEGTRLNWRNTMTKWFIDCISVGALGNTVVFLVLMGLMKGKGTEQIMAAVRKDTIPIIVAGYKIWPIASIVSFSLVPVEKRIVFLSAVGLAWGVYMSLVAARQ